MSKNQEYIEQYAGYAMEQMRRYGIPASVTLAQGICESAGGRSELSRKGNNHFGIKATTDWLDNGGEFLVYTDDRPNEKFCRYADAGESYEHHSQFLKENKRYAALFRLPPDDYKGWTNGLQKAGYASSRQYAVALQNIIENNGLQKYDQMVMKEMKAQGKSVGATSNPQLETGSLDTDAPTLMDAEGRKYSFPLQRSGFMLVTSPFGIREDPLDAGKTQTHKGMDIQTANEAVLATEDKGKVVRINNNADSSGGRSLTVEYDRKDGSRYQCTYMHLGGIAVHTGDCVSAGQKLGVSGNSGTRTTGEHLHFEVKALSPDGTKRDIDPAAYLAEIAQKGNIQLQALYNGRDITAQYKESNPAANDRVFTEADMTPGEWMKKLLSSEDSGVNMPAGDPVVELAMTMFTSLMALAIRIDNESEEEKMQAATNAAVTRQIDLTPLLPSYKACSISLRDDKPYLQADNGIVRLSRELTDAETQKIQLTLGNAGLSDDDKRRDIASVINCAVISQQMSRNYQTGLEAQQERQETMQLK